MQGRCAAVKIFCGHYCATEKLHIDLQPNSCSSTFYATRCFPGHSRPDATGHSEFAGRTGNDAECPGRAISYQSTGGVEAYKTAHRMRAAGPATAGTRDLLCLQSRKNERSRPLAQPVPRPVGSPLQRT